MATTKKAAKKKVSKAKVSTEEKKAGRPARVLKTAHRVGPRRKRRDPVVDPKVLKTSVEAGKAA